MNEYDQYINILLLYHNIIIEYMRKNSISQLKQI